MSLLRRHFALVLCGMALVFATSASAGLYGFSSVEQPQKTVYETVPPRKILNYRKAMRDLVVSISEFGKSQNKHFVVLPHEGQYLFNKSLWEEDLGYYNQIRSTKGYVDDTSFLSEDATDAKDLPPHVNKYINAVDGIVVNNHYCEHRPLDNEITQTQLPVFSIEQCASEQKLDDAITESLKDKIAIYPFLYSQAAFKKVVKQLIINENADNIFTPKQARNITFLLNDEDYADRYRLIGDVRNSNFDMVVIDPFFQSKTPYTPEDVDSLKYKKNGAKRLVLAAVNLSELSENSYLWHKEWRKSRPNWLVVKSVVTPHTFVAQYWLPEWKHLLSRHIKGITDSGYDGVFLTGIENHRYFEQPLPLE